MKERVGITLWGVRLSVKDGLQVTVTGLMSSWLVTGRLLVRSRLLLECQSVDVQDTSPLLLLAVTLHG